VIRHIASIAEIVEDMAAAVAFYRDVPGLEVEWNEGTGYATAKVAGAMHFGIWSRESAAEATLGDKEAASRIPLGFTVEFEVDEVQAASSTLESKGWQVLQAPRTEDWGQTTSRFLSPSGAICGVAETPWARDLSGS
jgi:catechol 2,3-dioxygenase-like lactoylglutathione lyase family enzyme